MTNTKSFLLSVIAVTGLLAAGCSNPADDTESARVSEAKTDIEAVADADIYNILPESKIGFEGSKVTGSHKGGFTRFEGVIAVAGGQIVPPSKVTIETASLWADNDRVANHLKSDDFFDVANIPASVFEITSVSGNQLTGNLTMHGVTRSIAFPAEVSITDTEVTLKAEFDIMRFDFGIAYKGKANDLIRDEVVIRLDVKAAKSA